MAANNINTMATNNVSTMAANSVTYTCNSYNVDLPLNGVANDIIWFKSYHPFSSHIGSIYAVSAPFPVLGIGTVELAVKASPGPFTIHGKSTIELHNVLHVPYYPCNVLGRQLASVYQIFEGSSASRGGLVLGGKQVAYFQPEPSNYISLT
ncbi:hypothetical protein B5807_01191 [Epicoccum nigrum]|uniref:Uncharacterized protein n=1 Tax=Epicoccum nigrum TaxID=105696 RepID=A0A1Y2MCZ6_EPING|nr:hypothetical protein B5807_01191 [Epicoccum nigrum]